MSDRAAHHHCNRWFVQQLLTDMVAILAGLQREADRYGVWLSRTLYKPSSIQLSMVPLWLVQLEQGAGLPGSFLPWTAMPCTTNDNDSDEADAFLHMLYTNGGITVSMFVIIFAETFLVTCFLYPELAFLHTMSSPANKQLYLVSDWWHHIVECIHYLEKITQLCRAWKITAVQYTQRLQILETNAVILYEVIGQLLENSQMSWCTGNPHAIDTTWPEIPLGTPQYHYSHAFHDNIETRRELAVSIMLACKSDRTLNHSSVSL